MTLGATSTEIPKARMQQPISNDRIIAGTEGRVKPPQKTHAYIDKGTKNKISNNLKQLNWVGSCDAVIPPEQ